MSRRPSAKRTARGNSAKVSKFQGGPSVEVFNSRDEKTWRKECLVSGASATIKQTYERGAKGFVCSIEGGLKVCSRLSFNGENDSGECT